MLEKLRRLPQNQQQQVLDFVEFLAHRASTQSSATLSVEKEQMAAAAQALLADYETDEELTAFKALDGEDFHA